MKVRVAGIVAAARRGVAGIVAAMRTIGKRVKIVSIDVPTLSGPTSGSSLWNEWEEWVTQATRWTIG